MLINEVSKVTNLTKKAIEYYSEKGLIFPSPLENGYREFSGNDVERLKKISVLRKLGISTNDIKTVLNDKEGYTLQKLSVRKELNVRREQVKKEILDELSSGKSYSEISDELKAIEDNKTITEKILEFFPGYYGRFICLYFARFLNEPITTKEKKSAYDKIISFLDNAPTFTLPENLQNYLMEGTKHIGTEQITGIIENTKKAVEKPDDFLTANKEILERYLEIKQSDEYKNSPAFQIQSLLKEFISTSGYYDIFIPALKKLSSSYAKYYKQLEMANEKLLAEYSNIAQFEN
ncbi:MAG: hypothetical protein PWQ77_1270 [Kosmotogales bacterium]|nr:hypothetical protein [Kosmotogales bacterium]